jgi:hypothetical protein
MRQLTLTLLGLSLTAAGMAFACPDAPPTAAPVVGTPAETVGYLDQPEFAIDRARRPPSTPYLPQPGDIMFSISNILILRTGHRLAGAGEPSHSAVVFRRPDGRLAILEAGPFDTFHIEILDLEPHLRAYEQRGRVWIRPRAVPLTEEQSYRLTEFAQIEEGKRFALLRLWGQVTPFRSRGPLRTFCVGGPHGPDRCSYYCAELVVEALVYAGTLNPDDTRPSATYPSDFFYDHSVNLFLKKHFKLAPCWGVPSRWSWCPLPG